MLAKIQSRVIMKEQKYFLKLAIITVTKELNKSDVINLDEEFGVF